MCVIGRHATTVLDFHERNRKIPSLFSKNIEKTSKILKNIVEILLFWKSVANNWESGMSVLVVAQWIGTLFSHQFWLDLLCPYRETMNVNFVENLVVL